ncbi:MAG: hypothetical protein AAF518_03645 [Spirochaetota bacterium]
MSEIRVGFVKEDEYGPDPIILRKRGSARNMHKKFELYKRKVDDPKYMEFAINKIALELSHFLSV